MIFEEYASKLVFPITNSFIKVFIKELTPRNASPIITFVSYAITDVIITEIKDLVKGYYYNDNDKGADHENMNYFIDQNNCTITIEV